MAFESADYGPWTALLDSPLWDSGPAWGGILDCTQPTSTSFDTFRIPTDSGNVWTSGIHGPHSDPSVFNDFSPDLIEIDWDGVLRTVTNITGPTAGCCTPPNDPNPKDCLQVQFTPPLTSAPRYATWFADYGALQIAAATKSFVPLLSSYVYERGDDASCAHPIEGTHCEIGPLESTSGSGGSGGGGWRPRR